MTNAPSPRDPSTQHRLQKQGTRDTVPELVLRRELHRRGLRYRVDHRPHPRVRRRADIVFRGPRVAVFVDGCFWHACPQHATWPVNNSSWWRDKLERNVARDRDTDQRLSSLGWVVIRVWEHEINEDVATVAERVRHVVEQRKP